MWSRGRLSSGHRGAQSGAAAVEFALLLIPLVLFLFGTIQFGLAYSRSQGMQAAAREGARVVAVGGDRDDAEAAARNAAPSFIRSEDIVADELDPGPCTQSMVAAGDHVTVTIRITSAEVDRYRIAIPTWGTSSPDFEAQGVFRCERAS